MEDKEPQDLKWKVDLLVEAVTGMGRPHFAKYVLGRGFGRDELEKFEMFLSDPHRGLSKEQIEAEYLEKFPGRTTEDLRELFEQLWEDGLQGKYPARILGR